MRKYHLFFALVAVVLATSVHTHGQPLAIEDRLKRANVVLTEVPGHTMQVREWLLSDPAYRALAVSVLKVIGSSRIIDPIPLEVINGKFKALLGVSYNDYVTADRYDDLDLIKQAIYRTWKERHIGSVRSSFQDILSRPTETPSAVEPGGNVVSIEVEYPKRADLIPRASFVATGRVISRVEPLDPMYIYSVIKTDKYYRQDSSRLSFSQAGKEWIAPWELNLVLGRPADIGLEGTLYLFVADKDNRRKLVKYYLNPRHSPHSRNNISSMASLELPIERSIPE
jgi:hypothetical protein